MEQYISLLRRHSGFSRLWVAQVISLLGDWFSTIVLAALVREYTDGSGYEGIAVSALFISQFLPPLIVSPIAGALVDRFNRKQLLVWSNLLRAIVVIGFLFVRDANGLWLLYGLRVVQFVLSAVFEPGQSAIVPSLVTRDDLTYANTLLSTTWSVMLAVGAVIGGIVGAIFGAQVAIIIDSITFVVAGLVIWSIVVPETTAAPTHEDDEADSDRSFVEGLRYFQRNPTKIAPLTIKMNGSIGNVDTILTFYATNLFILGEGGVLSLGVLYAMFGVGALMGPILMNYFNDGSVRELRRMVTIGFFLIVLGWFGLGAAPTLLITALAITLRAMGGSVNWVYSTTMIQTSVPDQYLGRAFAIDMAGFYFASGVSLVVHGLLIDAFGVENIRTIVYVTGAISIIPFVGWWWYLAWQERRTAQQTVTVENLP